MRSSMLSGIFTSGRRPQGFLSTLLKVPNDDCDDDSDGDDDDDDDGDNDSDDGTVAVLVRQSLGRYPSTMYVGLHENHLFYIKDRNRFAKSYRCSRCSQLWKTAWEQQRHEWRCHQQVRYTFPGGWYRPNATVADQLEDEGFVVPDTLRFPRFFDVHDYECRLQHHREPGSDQEDKEQ